MDQDEADLLAVLEGDDGTAQAFLRLVKHPADIVESLRVVDIDQWPRLLNLLADDETRAGVLAEVDEDEREELLEVLPDEQIPALLVEMESDDAADLVGYLEPEERTAALSALPEEDRREIEELLTSGEETAGGIMQLERADVNADATIQATIERVRELHEDEGIQVHRVYVVDDNNKLLGSLSLVDLVLHHGDEPVGKFLEAPLATVTPDVDQEEVAEIFRKYDLVVLPVVDHDGRLLGRISFDDIVDVLADEAEEDALLAAGIDTGNADPEEVLYGDAATRIALLRLPWIGVNLIGSLISAALLHLYEPVIEQAVLIASFIPVITAMGGNVGTQSATILTRGLATGRIEIRDLPRTVFRELRVGLVMGLLCGVLVGVIAAFLFGEGRVALGVVVGSAMISAMTTAAVVGAIAPAAMERFGVDPAIASGPFVTTANDVIGIVIYMSTALLFLEQIR
jgi:magnesium transporter